MRSLSAHRYLFVWWLLLIPASIGEVRVPLVVSPTDQAQAPALKLLAQELISNVYASGVLETARVDQILVDVLNTTNNPVDDFAMLQSYATSKVVAFALVLDKNPALPTAFDEPGYIVLYIPDKLHFHLVTVFYAYPRQIPAFWFYEDEHVTESIGLQFLPSVLFDAVDSILDQFGWRNVHIVYSAKYMDDASSLNARLKPTTNVSTLSIVDSSETSITVRNALELSTSRVIIAVLEAQELLDFASVLSSVRFEIVWVDTKARVGSHVVVNSTEIAFRLQSNVKSIISIEGDSMPSQYQELYQRYPSASASASFGPWIHDAVQLYANTINKTAIGTENDPSLVRSSILSLSPPANLIGGAPKWDASGRRIGDVKVFNYQWSATSPRWYQVGTWNQDNALDLDEAAVMFADGTSNVPAANGLPSFAIGLLYGTSAFFNSWKLATEYALADMAAANTVPGYQIRAITEVVTDAATSLVGSVNLVRRGVVGVVGSSRSSYAVAVQYYLGASGMPQLSPAATTDSLSDKSQYPSFLRVVPADRYQGVALASLVRHFGWTCATVVHFQEEYASNIATQFIAIAETNNITVSRISFRLTQTDFTDVLVSIRASQCHIVVAVLDVTSGVYVRLLNQAKSFELFGNARYQWIFTDIMLAEFKEQQLRDKNMTVSDFEARSVWCTSPQQYEVGTPIYQSFNERLSAAAPVGGDGYAAYTYDSIMLMGKAIARLLAKGGNPRDSRALLAEVKNTTLDGVSGFIRLDSNGDRESGLYGYFNYQSKYAAAKMVGVNRGGAVEISDYIFADGTQVIPADRVLIPTQPISVLEGLALIIIAGIALLLLIASLVLLVYWRARSLIIRSSPLFLAMITLGSMLAITSVFFWFGDVTPALCHLRVWFPFVGIFISYGALLSKNARLWYLISEPSLRVIAITNAQLLLALLGLVTPVLICLILWSSLAPFQIVPVLNGQGTIRVLTCHNSNDRIFAPILFAYFGLLLLAGLLLSFKTRKLPDTFRESRFIALATYNNVFVTIICVAIGYILSYEPYATTFIACAGILFGCLLQVALVFIPKFWLLRYRSEEASNSRMYSANSTNSATMVMSTQNGLMSGNASSVIAKSKTSRSSARRSEAPDSKASAENAAESESSD